MREQNIKIISTGVYHPENKVNNEYFISHFKEIGIDVEGLLEHLEREERYLSNDKNETVITMAYDASMKALNEANLNIRDIDLLIFATDTPEYTSPSNAVKLLDMLGRGDVRIKMAYDTNSNCLGMITALDQASRILMTNKRFKRALVVGGILFSSVGNSKDSVSYPNFGDAAAAVILDKVEEDEKSGFIDSIHLAQTSESNNILMPKIGYSSITKNGVENGEDNKWFWEPFDGSFISDVWVDLIKEIAEDNEISPKDINHLIFSQFTVPDARLTLRKLGIDVNKTTYIGNEYGYTGTTSPILALDRALKTGRINKGDYVTLASMGSGSVVTVLLFKF
ncbi:ketoacyl-ACP synthase III [Clostridium sp. AL.422]|uniref:ketoacyl-ACP synthase III n=1 Tax=Clostridium TaxID=1485 RepID=UPI00293DCFD9|nr:MULTISPECIES: ketoacyl-ACP synthase III [unclassified Clostridium]MDV4149272.1 ketoacyl-ACP synthase III [Clostridium sp. AL.422]